MRARHLFILIIEGIALQRFEEGLGFPGVFQQEILGAAGVIDARNRLSAFQQAKRVATRILLRALNGRVAIGQPIAAAGTARHIAATVVHAGGEATDGAIVLRPRDADAQRARAAHGKARDEIVLPLIAQRKEAAHDGGKFVRNIGKILAAMGHVHIGTQVPAGHDHSQARALDIALDGRAALPGGFIVARAVQ